MLAMAGGFEEPSLSDYSGKADNLLIQNRPRETDLTITVSEQTPVQKTRHYSRPGITSTQGRNSDQSGLRHLPRSNNWIFRSEFSSFSRSENVRKVLNEW